MWSREFPARNSEFPRGLRARSRHARNSVPGRSRLRPLRFGGQAVPRADAAQGANAAWRSRGAMRPRFCVTFTLHENRGRRESRAPIAPAVVRTKNARVDQRFNRITPAFPARRVTAYFVISPVTGLFATVALRISQSKFRRRRFAAPFVRAPADRSREHPPCDPVCAPDAVASIASHRAFVTTRDPPLLGVRRAESNH